MASDAYQAALKMLSRRDYFRSELEDRLSQKGFQSNEIDGAIGRCGELDLVNDERLAERFVEFRATSRGWGPRRLAAELRRRGVSRELAESASRIARGTFDEAMGVALRRTEVRAPSGWWRLPERRARMVSSLIARGFEAETAIEAVERLATTREKEHHALDDQ